MATWQLPILLAMGVVWIVLGGYLLRRNLRQRVARREGVLNRCLVISLLAGMGGGLGGVAAGLIGAVIAKELVIKAIWLTLPTAAAAFCGLSFLTLFASFHLSVRASGEAWLKSFGPPLILMAAVAIPGVWVANARRQNELAQIQSVNCLQSIYAGIAQRYLSDRPPAKLSELVEGNVIAPQYLRARKHPRREVGYFYHPNSLVLENQPTRKLLVCDWADNLDGTTRTVVYANGKIEVLGEYRFQETVNLAENKAFAAALKEAEAKLSADN